MTVESYGLRARELAAIATVALLLGTATAWLIPFAAGTTDPSCAPDEDAHLAFVEALAEGNFGTWPEVNSRMAMFPPAPYLLHVAGRLVARHGGDADWQYRVVPRDPRVRGFPLARLGSVVLGVAAVLWLTIASALFSRSREVGVACGLVAALYPQRFFLSGYVNNDVGTFAAGSLLVLALARWWSRGEARSGTAGIGLALGCVLVSKTAGYALIPGTVIWLGWAAGTRRIAWRTLLLTGLASAAVAVPVLSWNAVRNGGDPLGLSVYRAFLASPAWRGSSDLRFPEDACLVFLRFLCRSAFMKFSNMRVDLPIALYVPWLGLMAAGGVAGGRRVWKLPAEYRRPAAWLVLGGVLSFAEIWYLCFFVDFSPQGRYVLLPVVLLTLTAFGAVAGPWARHGRVVLLGGLGYFAIAALWSMWLLVEEPCGPGIEIPGREGGAAVVSGGERLQEKGVRVRAGLG